MEFSQRIRALRLEKGLTMEEASAAIQQLTGVKISKGQLSKWESGKELCSLSNSVAIAIFYGVSIDYLIGLTDDPKPSSMTRMIAYLEKIREANK